MSLTSLRKAISRSRSARAKRARKASRRSLRNRQLRCEPLEDRRLLSVVPNDPLFSDQWALDNTGQTGGTPDADIDAPAAWSITTGSPSTVVAVLDTGIDYTHEDLYLNIWLNQGEIPSSLGSSLSDTDADGLITYRDLNDLANASYVSDLNATGYIDAGDLINDPTWADGADTDGNGYVDDISGYDFIANVADPMDDNGHGTIVAGILGAMGDNATGVAGVVWNTQLMPLRFHDGYGNGSINGGAEAINYAVANGASVSNNSWGAPGWPSDAGYSEIVRTAIANAAAVGHIVVAAAGNGGTDWIGDNNDNPDDAVYPASYDLDNIVAVAATEKDDHLALFSNYGAATVDVGAPGVNIWSTVPTTSGMFADPSGYWLGRTATSWATPHVTGVVALVQSQHPEWTYSQVIDKILATVDPSPSLQGKTVSGGRVNAAAAVDSPIVETSEVSIDDVSATEGDTRPQLVDDFVTDRLGGLHNPRGIAFDSQGDLFVASSEPAQVLQYDGLTGEFVGVFADASEGGSNPWAGGLEFDDNYMYVTTGWNNGVLRFDAQTGVPAPAAGQNGATFVSPGAGGLSEVWGMAVGPDGHLYVGSFDTDAVLRYDGATGELIDVFVTAGNGGLNGPGALIFDANGLLYVGSSVTNEVLRYQGPSGTSPGAFLDAFVPARSGGLDDITGFAFGPGSDLYVSSFHTDEVLRYSGATGDFIDSITAASAGTLDFPIEIAFDDDGTLYAASCDTHRVLRSAPSSQAVFTASLSFPNRFVPVTVDFNTIPGTATPGSDYVSAAGTLTFAPGETSKVIVVTTLDDVIVEDNETFTMELSNPTGGAMIVDPQGVATILDADGPLFSDSFENGQWNGKWVEDYQNDWFTSTQRETDGNYSAEVDGRATNATLTMAQAVDMTPYGSAELTFDWYIEKGFDSGEYLALDFSPDGSTWTEIKRLRGNVDQENTWHSETIDVDPTFLTDGFKIRYRAYVSGSREDANVDNVQLWATSLAAPPNQAPVAENDSDTTDEDTAVVIDVLANDSDPDLDPLQVDSVGVASHGAVVNNDDGTVTYTPGLNFHGGDSFTYTVGDGKGGSDTGTVNVTITPVNDAPAATNDAYSVDEDTTLDVGAAGVLGNDGDVDGDSLTASVIGGVSSGSLALNSDGSFTYTPNADFNGADSFTYEVSDGDLTDQATVNITVDPVNDAPVVASPIADVNVNEDAVDTVMDLSGTFSDVDTGDSLTLSVQSNTDATLVTASLVGNTLTLDYQPDQNGSATVTIRGTDGPGDFAEDSFLVAVNPVNDAPVAAVDSYSVDQDTTLNVPADGVLGNDTDVDGDPLNSLIVDEPSNGSVTLALDGSFMYTPNGGFYGSDSFTYQAHDQSLGSNIATVSITVDRVNNVPVAVDDSTYSVNEDNPLNVAAPGVLGNDSDADSDPLTAVLVSGPADGLLTLNADGSFSYTPNADFNGGDSFTYVANDGFADSNLATVSIAVNPVNDAPVADSQSVSTPEDTAKAITLTGSDADGDPLTFDVVDEPANGVLTGTAPNLTYTPAGNYNGPDSFTFRVYDGTDYSLPAIVSITVDPVNDAPVANADSATTDEDTAVDITLSGSDVDGDSLSYAIATSPSHGTLSGSGANLTYTPDADYNGADSFTFVANDGTIDSAEAIVSITIDPINDAPVADDQSVATSQDAAVDITLTASDVDGDGLSYAIVAPPSHGALSGSGANLTYTPDTGYDGPDSFTFVANDGTVDSAEATVSIDVTPVASGPKLSHGVVTNVGSGGWTTVTLGRTYTDMVVIATPNYDSGDAPGVTRIQNAAGNSFDVRVDAAGGVALSDVDVHYVVVEADVYDEPGYKMEAVKFNSTRTDENNSWVGESRSYLQSYSNPVVIGQVMTYTDPDWSVFWACGSSRSAPPTSSALKVGKHVGEDADTTRANETIGYLVIETSTSGSAEIEGLRYVAALGGDTIRGVGDAPAYSYGYSAMPNSKAAVVTMAAMDGGNGGWAVLYGSDSISPTGNTLKLAIDEDQANDTERRHTSEQVAYLIIDPPAEAATGQAATASQQFVASPLAMAGLPTRAVPGRTVVAGLPTEPLGSRAMAGLPTEPLRQTEGLHQSVRDQVTRAQQPAEATDVAITELTTSQQDEEGQTDFEPIADLLDDLLPAWIRS